MFLRNSLKFDINTQHVIGTTQYPRGWFLDLSERAKLGITEVADIPQPDPALYDSTENPDGTWTSTPRDPAVIEAESLAKAVAIQDETDATTIRTNATVRALITARPVQIEDYINTNVNNLAKAKEVLIILAKAISAIGKQQFK